MTNTHDLGERISNRIHEMQSQIELHQQEIDSLRSTMFQVATALRMKDPDAFADEIHTLESPAMGCTGDSCITAIALKSRINQLEQELFEHESVMFNLTSQLSINPFSDDQTDSPCCPRIVPKDIP